MNRDNIIQWAEDYKDSMMIGPHGLHDSTMGDIARFLLAEHEARVKAEAALAYTGQQLSKAWLDAEANAADTQRMNWLDTNVPNGNFRTMMESSGARMWNGTFRELIDRLIIEQKKIK
jgi:hypothetical protein